MFSTVCNGCFRMDIFICWRERILWVVSDRIQGTLLLTPLKTKQNSSKHSWMVTYSWPAVPPDLLLHGSCWRWVCVIWSASQIQDTWTLARDSQGKQRSREDQADFITNSFMMVSGRADVTTWRTRLHQLAPRAQDPSRPTFPTPTGHLTRSFRPLVPTVVLSTEWLREYHPHYNEMSGAKSQEGGNGACLIIC